MIKHFKQRPPLFISAAFVFPAAVLYYGEADITWSIIFLLLGVTVAFCLAIFLFCRFKPSFTDVIVIICILAFFLSFVLVKQRNHSYKTALDYAGAKIEAEGRVTYLEDIRHGYIVHLNVHKVFGEKVNPFGIKVVVYGTARPRLYDTAVFSVDAEKFPVGQYGDGIRDYYRSNGIFLTGQGGFERVCDGGGVFYAIIRKIRGVMDDALKKLDNYGLAKALIMGDRTFLDDSLKKIFDKAGASHILALSGLHVSIILLVLVRITNMVVLNKKGLLVLYTGILWLFSIVTGSAYSVVRAVIMTVLGFAGVFFKRRSDLINGVAVALLFIVVSDPYAVGNISLQLSCLAVTGIASVTPFLTKTVGFIDKKSGRNNIIILKILKSVYSSVICTLFVTLFTFPVAVNVYGGISMVSFLSNVVLIPLMTPVMVLLAVYVLMYSLPFFREFAVSVLSEAVDFTTDIFTGVAGIFGDLGFGQIFVGTEYRITVSVILMCILVWAILSNVKTKGLFIILCIAVVLCMVCILLEAVSCSTEVQVMNDDGGFCSVFEKNGTTFVYKGSGNPYYNISEYCRNKGKQHIDCVILSPSPEGYGEFFEQLYTSGINVNRVYCFEYTDTKIKERMKEYFSLHSTEFLEYGDGTSFENQFTFYIRDLSCYWLRCETNGKNIVISSPVGFLHKDMTAGEIMVCGGKAADSPVFKQQNVGCVIADFSNTGEYLKTMYPHTDMHELSSHKVHIFKVDKRKISMRCKIYGV